MAAKRKPRPSSSQPVTLHRFFSGPGQARDAGAKPKLSQEVIVIDSDDELEPGVDGKGDPACTSYASYAPSKRRRTGSSGDIEVVGDRTVEPIPSSVSDILLFGKPSALLRLPREANIPVSSNSHRILNGQASSSSTTLDDDWNMGDDEQPIADSEPIRELETALPSNTPAIDGCQLTSCPMCEVAFDNSSLQVRTHSHLLTVYLTPSSIWRTTSIDASTRPQHPFRISSHQITRMQSTQDYAAVAAAAKRMGMHSTYSCPLTRRAMHGRKLPSWRTVTLDRRRRTAGEGKPHFTRSCKECPSLSTHFDTVRYPVSPRIS